MRMISSWWWHRLFLILLPFTKKQLTTIHGQDTAERTVEHGLVAEAPPYIAETKTECFRSLRGMVTFWPHSPPSGLGAASPTEPREGKPTFSPTYCWITLPEHTEICVAHPTALLTMTLEQSIQHVAFSVCRAKPVALPGQDIQCTFLLFDSSPQQWAMQALGPVLQPHQGRKANS